MAVGGASSSVHIAQGGQLSAGAAVLSSLRPTFGRSVVTTHILTLHVATILTHVSANIWLALRASRRGR